MNEEMMRILKMVEEGKVSAEQAKSLMDAFNKVSTVPAVTNYDDQFFKVNVLSTKGDKVNIKLPVKVIKAILQLTGKLPTDVVNIQGVNTEEMINTIISCLNSEVMGEIVSIDSAEGDKVRICIE